MPRGSNGDAGHLLLKWGRERGWAMGFEPTTPGATVQCSTVELHPPHGRSRCSRHLDLVRQDNDVLVYMRPSERKVSERDNYRKIAYRFYKDKFSAGIIQTYGNEAKSKLRKSLVKRHGEPVRVSRRQELDAWDGERVQIVLSCSVTSYCAAEFISKEMVALEEQETGKPVQVLNRDSD